jgi:magnesium chelatase family protein
MHGEGDDGRSGAHGKKATRGCPCSHLGDPVRACRCKPAAVERYRARISGPLLDRIDIHLLVPAVPASELSGNGPAAEGSAAIRARIEAARRIQRERFRELKLARTIADLAGAPGIEPAHVSEAIQYCSLDRSRAVA